MNGCLMTAIAACVLSGQRFASGRILPNRYMYGFVSEQATIIFWSVAFVISLVVVVLLCSMRADPFENSERLKKMVTYFTAMVLMAGGHFSTIELLHASAPIYKPTARAVQAGYYFGAIYPKYLLP